MSWKRSSRCIPFFTCWHPLLPTFSARIIFALRTLLGIACCATFSLSPVTSQAIQGQLLLGAGFIVAIKSTLGATIQTASRLFLAGGIAATYCLLIVKFFPKNIYYAVGATNVFVLIIVYTDLPTIVRRFSILPACVILLQWSKQSHIDKIYILHTWASLSIGGGLAIIVSCIPLPLLPTAYRELTMRMKFTARQIRREITAIVLLISEYHNVHLRDNYDRKIGRPKYKSNSSHDDEIGIQRNSYRDHDRNDHSASFENLKDDHLLKSDIQDLHLLVNEEIKHMQRALTEIPFEPYFIVLKSLNLIRDICRSIPLIKNCIKKSSKLQMRLEVWAICFASLQRTITGMLSLDHHHHAFVGQRQLINAICLLLDSAFNFLDSTLPYTTSSTSYINIPHIVESRANVDEALEHFFQTYAQIRVNRHHANMSNTDAILLNTFLLLVLRLIHVILTAAETSETPGTSLDIDPEQMIDSPLLTRLSIWKKRFRDLATYIGLKPSSEKFIRAIKTSLSVLVSAVVVLRYHERLQAYGWIYWAPMTTALVSDSSEGGTIRLSLQRLMAVLLGSTYAYIVVLVAHDQLAIGIFISLFVAFMGYVKTDSEKEYFASVCAQSASIITFISKQEGVEESNKAVLARTSLTFLGIFIHVFISNLFLPISARELIKKKVFVMIDSVSVTLKSVSDDFCTFIQPTAATNFHLIDQQLASSNKTSMNLIDTLAQTERIADDFPSLLEEALSEPNFWKRPFIEVKDRYNDISKTLRRITLNIRFVHRCTTILKAETKLHLVQEAQQLRRTSVVPINNNNNNETTKSHAWTMTELRQQKQLQNDLDIPLTIFMTYTRRSSVNFKKKPLVSNNSTTSLRTTNIGSYQPVLEHICMLEKHIQQVLLLTRQLIEKQATVDVGSFELQQLCREDSLDEQQTKRSRRNTSYRRSSFHPVTQFTSIPMVTSHSKIFSYCFTNQQKNNQPLPSLRHAVDLMLAALIQFLYANNDFIRRELVSTQSIGDILAFHTLSYAFKDMVEATTELAKNARRIKHIDTRTLIHVEREDKSG